MRVMLGRIFYFYTLLSLEHDLPTELFPGASRRDSLRDLDAPGPKLREKCLARHLRTNRYMFSMNQHFGSYLGILVKRCCPFPLKSHGDSEGVRPGALRSRNMMRWKMEKIEREEFRERERKRAQARERLRAECDVESSRGYAVFYRRHMFLTLCTDISLLTNFYQDIIYVNVTIYARHISRRHIAKTRNTRVRERHITSYLSSPGKPSVFSTVLRASLSWVEM